MKQVLGKNRIEGWVVLTNGGILDIKSSDIDTQEDLEKAERLL